MKIIRSYINSKNEFHKEKYKVLFEDKIYYYYKCCGNLERFNKEFLCKKDGLNVYCIEI